MAQDWKELTELTRGADLEVERVRLKDSRVAIEGNFELQGKHFALQPVAIPVKARSLMESKTDFDFGV